MEDKTEETPAQRVVLPARASAQAIGLSRMPPSFVGTSREAVLRSAAISAACVCLYLYEDLPGE